MGGADLIADGRAAHAAVERLPSLERRMDDAAARRVAKDFEAVFLSEMLRPMFEGVSAEAPFGGGSTEDMWRSMQIGEVGKAIARQGGIGLADTVMAEIIRLQEAQAR